MLLFGQTKISQRQFYYKNENVYFGVLKVRGAVKGHETFTTTC
jgi:hypothetical protein